MGKPRLSLWQIVKMNLGFLGLQYSFGLQQANMSPIYSYLGAEASTLPLLWLAGPMTGLILQPIVGALSDKTITPWGRRTPYFFFGAIFCSIALLVMPFSTSVAMAACVLWILDAANNITLEPYRAFVSDKLDKTQHSLGFLTQSAFTGLGQTLSYLTPFLLIHWAGVSESARAGKIPLTTLLAFIIGSVVSIGSILLTLKTTKEIPLTEEEKARIRSSPQGVRSTLLEIFSALREMPATMKQMIPMMAFTWYALFVYWQYIVACLAQSLYQVSNVLDPLYRSAELLVGPLGAFYNCIAFFSSFLLMRLSKRFGPVGIHAVCLALAGIGLLCIPALSSQTLLFLPMVGLGLAWASLMGNPYTILAGVVPQSKIGVYMGIFNLFIVVPMLVETFTMPFLYRNWLGNDPTQAIRFAGVLLLLGALASAWIQVGPGQPDEAERGLS